MYHSYFGLKEAPFSIAVNPRYLFMSARHRDALAHLIYGVGVGGGFILLTGEVGTGKTTINRCLLEQLPDNTDIALILNPALNADELLASVCDELHISYDAGENSLKVLTDKLHQFLLRNHANNRNTVLLIDEAQHLKLEVLEQIRLLTNLETKTKKLLQIILVGQPELRALLNKPELRQLAQRITARYQLKPLNLPETNAYIHHRLQVAGLPAGQEIFPAKIIKQIFKISRGIPRIINVLCDRMLLGCYGQNKSVVDKAMLKQAVVEVMGEEEDIQLKTSASKMPALVATAVLVAGLALWQWPTVLIKQQPAQVLAANTEAATLTTSELTTTAVTTAPEPSPWIEDKHQAILELMQAIGLEKHSDPCFTASSPELRCEQLTVKTWQALFSYNRPAVLSLITSAKMQTYAILIGIHNDQAMLLRQGHITRIPLQQLGEMWTGNFIFIWQTTTLYTEPFSLFHSGPVVQWLAQRFARLDQQQTRLADQDFNRALAQRVTIFQQNHGLQADGVVGVKTLLKLEELLEPVMTLEQLASTDFKLTTEPSAAISGQQED